MSNYNFKILKSLNNSENPLKTVGLYGIIEVIKALCNCLATLINTITQTKAAKEVEDYKLKKAKELEEKKTEERIKRLEAEEKFRRKKKRIGKWNILNDPDLHNQQAPSISAEGSDPMGDLLTTQDLFNRSRGFRRSDRWIVQGYVKPGQITMFTAGSGVGKSVLLTQIAEAVVKGVRPEFLPDTCCASLKQDVVYYRIEDFSDELEGKYGKGKVLDNPNIMWFIPKSRTLDGVLGHIKQIARQLKHDTVICIDPATKLDGYSHEACIKGLEEAQRISKAKGITLSFIVAAHLDEIKDWKPLTTENIKGGDKAVQQAGAVIALRMEGTPDGDHRFIQCLKAPKGDPMPFPQGVLVCKKVKTEIDADNWYLHFEFVEIKPEKDALPDKPKANKGDKVSKPSNAATEKPVDIPQRKAPNMKLSDEDKDEIVNLLRKGVKSAVVAKQFKVSLRTVQRIKSERA